MSWEVLRTREHSLGLAGVDPLGGEIGDHVGIGSECARADYRVVGLHIQVAVRCVHPVDPDAQCLTGREARGAAYRVCIAKCSECSERRQASQATELLSGAALQVGPDQEPHARALAQLLGETCHRFRGPAEEDETAYAELERQLHHGAVELEAMLLVPADCWKQQL